MYRIFSANHARFSLAMMAAVLCFAPLSAAAQNSGTQNSGSQNAGQSAAQQTDPTLAPAPQEEEPHHGRKYKAPPVTSHIEVDVLGGLLGNKPVTNASVIFHPLSETGRDEGSYEVKTDSDGKAVIDVIPKGTTVILQVLTPGYNTFGETVLVNDLQQNFTVKLERPRSQYSVYTQDNNRPSTVQPGLLEPAKPEVPKPPPTAGALVGSADANKNASKGLSIITPASTTTQNGDASAVVTSTTPTTGGSSTTPATTQPTAAK